MPCFDSECQSLSQSVDDQVRILPTEIEPRWCKDYEVGYVWSSMGRKSDYIFYNLLFVYC